MGNIMDVTVTETDTKKGKLTVSGKNIRIKLNRHWDDSTKEEVKYRLILVAQEIVPRNLGYTMRGTYTLDHPHVIQMKSGNKTSPKRLNINVHDLICGSGIV